MAIETRVWIYWGCCLLAGAVMVARRERAAQLLGRRCHAAGRRPALWLAWGLSLATALAYVCLTRRVGPGSYSSADVIVFSLLNGVLEQLMFVFWFLCGCLLGRRLAPHREGWVFVCGYMACFAYSGLIHPLFWFDVLPTHVPATAAMVSLLTATSLAWMWSLWRHRALGAIVAMHCVVDLVMVGHLHSPWVEPLPLR